MMIRTIIYLAVVFLCSCTHSDNTPDTRVVTVCNPIDLSYRFRPETHEVSRREAADPTLIKFNNEYWLFASKSGGYWYSSDLKQWNFVRSTSIPTEGYAPTVIALRDTLFMAVSSKHNKKVYKTADPHSGLWVSQHTLTRPVEDPCFYQDNDKRLYLYWGCSNKNPLYGTEIDPISFKQIDETKALFNQKPDKYGWEIRGDYNTEYDNTAWLEGLWMTKKEDTYYLQYSAPGTLEKSYADGVYISDNPLGPFKLQDHNPFSYKPEGFACGAGHGSTITDSYGNYWHLGTISISQKHKFERRLGFYPAFYDEDNVMYTQTQYGDYPITIPSAKVESFEDLFPGWMLLSYKKKVSVSSTLSPEFSATQMVDENIRSYWAAASQSKDEWATIDLDAKKDVYAIQINFAEHNTQIYDRQADLKYQYIIEASCDSIKWQTIIDQSNHDNDNSHAYHQLPQKVSCRYVRIKEIHMADGNVALCGFRVFGLANGAKPTKVTALKAKRNAVDRRAVTLNWDKQANATGYVISYGNSETKLYHSYMVYENNSVTIRSLNKNLPYFFSIESFNESGITKSSLVIVAE